MPTQLFRPPPVDITADLRWLLLRAFGPAGAPATGPVAGAEVLRLAQVYRLVQRLAARTPGETLVGELGRDAALRLVSLQTLGEAKSRALAAALPGIAAAAEAASAPVVLLKYAALLALGVVTPAGRVARDIDVLVAGARARALFDALVGAGYVRATDVGRVPLGQLPPLVDAAGGVRVEIHTSLLGIRTPTGNGQVGFAELREAGVLTEASGPGAGCLVPSAELIVAHLLVHGMVQHGFSPRSYSLLKMIADLIDLGLAGPGGGDLLAAACRWLPADGWGVDVAAVRTLCAALADGDAVPLEPAATGSPARALLDHCLAGPVDTGYRRRLKLRKLLHGSAIRGRSRTLAWSARSLVFLSRREIDIHYGVPRSRWGYLGYRLLWPFDLLFHKLPSALLGAVGRSRRRQP